MYACIYGYMYTLNYGYMDRWIDGYADMRIVHTSVYGHIFLHGRKSGARVGGRVKGWGIWGGGGSMNLHDCISLFIGVFCKHYHYRTP